jgi:hypothetical protein
MTYFRKSQTGRRIWYILSVVLILFIAACGPTDGNDDENAALPTLVEQSESVAQMPTQGLLPTLVPYPTLPPSATPTEVEPLEPEIDQPEATAEVTEPSADDPFAAGGIEFPPDAGPPGSEDEAGTQPENLDLPPGVDPDDVITGSGGTLDQEGEQGPPGLDLMAEATPEVPGGSGASDDPFTGGGISFDGPPGVDLGDTTGGSSDAFSDLPFDPNEGPGGDFGGDPFSEASGAPGASSTHVIGGQQPVSVFECPETTCDVIGTLEAGDPVVVVEESGEWIGIEFQGNTAYVFGTFVAERQQQQEQTPFGEGSDFPPGFEGEGSGDPFNDESGLPFDPDAGTDDPFGSGPPGAFGSTGSSTTGRYIEGSGFSTGSGFGSMNTNPLFNAPSTGTDDPFGGGPPFDTGTGNPTGGVPGVDCPPFLDSCS